jgi:quercetin 2,3-dioxygenase
MARPVRIISRSLFTSVGPLSVAQSLPAPALRDADPFLLLHHAGPQRFEAGAEAHRIEPHPHRGFEPVTFVYRGSVLHRDSLGNAGSIGAGEVQWITSGSGILHSEGPTPDLMEHGGELELIQLWINLPASKKMMTPAYQELHRTDIPVIDALDGAMSLAVVAGTYAGVRGPAVTQSPLSAIMGTMRQGGKGTLAAPSERRVLLYVLGGSVLVNGEHRVDEQQLVVFEDGTGDVDLEILADGNILLLGGDPIGEPIASYGPFVMNTDDELRAAFRDYAGGKFGVLSE